MRAVAVLVAALALAGCGEAFKLGEARGPVVVRCPTALPAELKCVECVDWTRPEIDAIEQLEAALDSAEASLLQCRVVNDRCVRRDRVVVESWRECGKN